LKLQYRSIYDASGTLKIKYKSTSYLVQNVNFDFKLYLSWFLKKFKFCLERNQFYRKFYLSSIWINTKLFYHFFRVILIENNCNQIVTFRRIERLLLWKRLLKILIENFAHETLFYANELTFCAQHEKCGQ
jgi:hypothetical protein